MTLSFACPHCGKEYRNLKPKLIGKKAKCACGKVIRIGESSGGVGTSGVGTTAGSAILPGDAGFTDLQKSLDPPSKAATSGSGEKSEQSKNSKKQRRPKTRDVPTVDFEKKSSIIGYQYSDLDALLAGDKVAAPEQRPEFSEELKPVDFEDALEAIPTSDPSNRIPSNQAVSVRSSVHESLGLQSPADDSAENSTNAKTSNTKPALSLLAAICCSTLAFWFGLLIVMSRFKNIDQFLLRDFTEMIRDINAGRFGSEMMAAELQTGFGVVGWIIWSVALLMMVLSACQFANAILQLFYRRQVLGWVDGFMAAAGIVFIFLAVVTLFLHSSHMTNLKRKLNEQSNQGAVGESNPDNISLISDRYDERSKKFIMVMLVSSMVPMTIFVLSMIRLFLSAGESGVSVRETPRPASGQV